MTCLEKTPKALLEDLNPQQREAVRHGGGPLLVFAGAGSGKTRVITHRIAHLVTGCGLRPWQILAVTFTNKAAGEMRSRVGTLLGEGLRDTWIGTFHATCAKLLRIHASEAGLARDFVIYDDGDQKSMVTRCLRDLNLDEKRFHPRAIQSRINTAKQECISADAYEPGDFFEDHVAKVYRLYEQRMAAAEALDFGDLLFRMYELLERDEGVRTSLQSKFLHLLVDEFQDTNKVQYQLLKKLVGPERNLCVVGDDDQSIYRWRGADVRNILDFRKDFPDAVVVKLEQNYRSTGNILASATAVIKRNRTRAPKTLWTENAKGDPLRLVTVSDEREEASFVVGTIREELGKGRPPGDMAVFYRINAQARVLEESLRAANIPYRVIGGMKFYERAEIKDVIAYLRVIHNPEDDVDLIRIINNPPRKIGLTTINRLLDEASRREISLFKTIRFALNDPDWKAATKAHLQGFVELIDELRGLLPKASPSELAVTVLERTGYLEALQSQDTPEAENRIENIKELVGSFELFEQEADDSSLAALLESISLVQDVDKLEENPPTVTLMTVHAAKGLEFPMVFLTGMEEDMFPYRRASEELDVHEQRERLEEERRLCYVAITRAREQLVLTNVVCRRIFGNERLCMASRFIDDIPAELVEVVGGARRATLVAHRRFSEDSLGYFSGTGDRRPRPASRSKTFNDGNVPAWAAKLDLPDGSGSRGARRRSPQSAPKAPPAGEPRVVLDGDIPSDGIEVTLQPGIKVRHKKFGVGKVRQVEDGLNPKVVVDFPEVGRKTIVARFLHPA